MCVCGLDNKPAIRGSSEACERLEGGLGGVAAGLDLDSIGSSSSGPGDLLVEAVDGSSGGVDGQLCQRRRDDGEEEDSGESHVRTDEKTLVGWLIGG